MQTSNSVTQDQQPSTLNIQQSDAVHRFRPPSILFSDPVDEDLSDAESFDEDDMYGSDSDAEIIGTESPKSVPLTSLTVNDTSVCSSIL
jgi:hypothetical protein